jgi:hypothetical protein
VTTGVGHGQITQAQTGRGAGVVINVSQLGPVKGHEHWQR